MAEIVAVDLDIDDGLDFDVVSIRTEVMRQDAEYQGVRVKLLAQLATAKITTTLDFSFGDPHRSTIVELPGLLGGTIRLPSYPPELSVGEKVATMMSRRELNTRDRDFADVWVLSRLRGFAAGELRGAIFEVADHRKHEVISLRVALADMPDRPRPYQAMLRRMAYRRQPPTSWSELLADLQAFVDPLLSDRDDDRDTKRWEPVVARWLRQDDSRLEPSAKEPRWS